MPISVTTAMPTSFKVAILRAFQDFTASTGNIFKLALLKATASGSGTFGAATTNYSDLGSDELGSGSGYATGGNTLTSITPTSDGTTAICDFDNTTWTSATFTTCGGLIYNSSTVASVSGRACAVLSFGGDQQVSSGDFQIQFPAAAAATAIIRIA
jgi:hypothetical protein